MSSYSNSTSYDTGGPTKGDSSVAIAVILPSFFAVVLIILLAIYIADRAFLLPTQESREEKEKRKKKRMAKLESAFNVQAYAEWINRQKERDPEAGWCAQALCVICLEEFSSTSQIRGLGCQHVFHQQCLDNWFSRWNEYCPLCHRPIIQSSNHAKKQQPEQERDAQAQTQVAQYMV